MRLILITTIYLIFPIIIVSIFHKWKFFQKIGTVIMSYFVGLLMSLTGMVAFEIGSAEFVTLSTIQKWIMNLTVPLAIPLMLFGSDFKLWSKSLPKTMITLAGGIISIVIAIVLAFFVFQDKGIIDLANVSSMMVGIYTGGSMNFFALASILHVNSNIVTLVYTFEMLVTFPLILFIVAGGYKLFRRLLPYSNKTQIKSEEKDVTTIDCGEENYANMLNKNIFPKTMFAFLLSIVFLLIGVCLSIYLTGKLSELIIIMTVTTLAIVASCSKKIRNLPKTFELGMLLILIFSIVVASQFDITALNTSAFTLLCFILFIMLTAVVLHILFCRFVKIDGDLFTVSNIALLCSPPFVPPVVGAMGNKKVLISGIVIGLVGYAVGTYLGVALSYLLAWF